MELKLDDEVSIVGTTYCNPAVVVEVVDDDEGGYTVIVARVEVAINNRNDKVWKITEKDQDQGIILSDEIMADAPLMEFKLKGKKWLWTANKSIKLKRGLEYSRK